MTAVCVIRQPERVTFITDGAFTDDDGVLKLVAPKVFLFPHLSGALAIVGPAGMAMHVAALLSVAPTFEDLLYRAASVARTIHNESGQGKDFELYLGGLTDRGSVSYLLPGHDRGEMKPWQLNVAPDVVANPVPAAYKSGPRFNPATEVLRLIEAQRLTVGPYGYGIGGFAQQTTITRDGIETKIIRRWPDVVGEKIRP